MPASKNAGTPASWADRAPLAALTLAAGAFMALLSIARHRRFGTNAFDLGNFDQIVWNYSRLRAPACTQLGLDNALGDHFSPVLALLAPLYWIAPRPETLLAAQAALIASSFVPVFLHAERRAGRWTASLLTLSYAAFWGVHRTAWFDFHPDAFAFPLIAWAVHFADAGRWRPAVAAILALLAVKEELALLVAAFGLYAALRGRPRLGAALAACGLAALALIVLALIPWFAGGGPQPEWIYNALGPDLPSSLAAGLKNPLRPLALLVSPPEKLRSYALLFGPFLFLPLLSKQFVLIAPLVATKALTDNPNMWSFSTHYAAFLCPLLATASADALAGLAERADPRSALAQALPFAPLVVLFANLLLIPYASPWKDALGSGLWTPVPAEKSADEALALIPSDASVGTQTGLAPRLARRRELRSLDREISCGEISPDFFVAQGEVGSYPVPFSEVEACLKAKKAAGYRTVFEREGWTVLKR